MLCTLPDLTVSEVLVLTSSAGVSKFAFLQNFLWSSFHLSEFSLNLLAFNQCRTWCTLGCKLLGPNFGTISKAVLSSANLHMADRELSVLVRSFIMTKRSQRPMQVACGIPLGLGEL